MNIDEMAWQEAEICQWPETHKEMADILAAFGRECAAKSYEDAARIVRELHEGEECGWSGEDTLKSKAASLRQSQPKGELWVI